MPIQVTCGGCGVVLTTPDTSAGKRAKCPKCGGPIQIPEADDEEYEVEPLETEPTSAGMAANAEDRRPCPACGEMIMREAVKCRFCGEVLDSSMRGVLGGSGKIDSVAWAKVSSGLATMYNCIGVIFGCALLIGILAGVVGAMNAGQRGGEEPTAILIVLGIGGLIMLGASIGVLVGLVRCTNVPEESDAHGFAVGAVVCFVANLLLSMIGGATDSNGLSGLASLMSLIGWVLFILFVKRSANYLGDHELASSAGKFLIFVVVIFVGAFALGVLSAVGGPALLAVVGIVAIVGGLAGFIWFLRLIRGLRLSIDRELGAPGLGAFAG